MKIQFIGCGKMGEAILKGFLKANIPAQDITVQETYQPQAEHIGATYHTHLGIDTDADIVVLAVKPQQIGNVDFAQFPKSALFFSIMAGITIARLEALSGSQNIIRSMPNLPLSVGRGVIGYVKYTDDDQEKTDLLVNAFSQIGKVIRLANEDQIDHISTISGSGPAYFYYLTDILRQEAQKIGFSEEDAIVMAQETFVGAAMLLDQSGLSAAQLQSNVASKGGSTQAALDTMKAQGIETAVQNGLKSAYQRAKELNG